VTGAQSVEVNQQNRTIELTTQSAVQVEADLVSVRVGYRDWGPRHDAACQENMCVAAQILKAGTDVGISQTKGEPCLRNLGFTAAIEPGIIRTEPER
jgi:hypothetical protein